ALHEGPAAAGERRLRSRRRGAGRRRGRPRGALTGRSARAVLAGPEVAAGVEAAVERAADRALELQRPDGSWVDELPSAAVATGAAALALHACDGDAASRYVDEACAWLRGAQSADGSWGDATGAEGTLNATAVAVAALAALGGSRSRAA